MVPPQGCNVASEFHLYQFVLCPLYNVRQPHWNCLLSANCPRPDKTSGLILWLVGYGLQKGIPKLAKTIQQLLKFTKKRKKIEYSSTYTMKFIDIIAALQTKIVDLIVILVILLEEFVDVLQTIAIHALVFLGRITHGNNIIRNICNQYYTQIIIIINI